MKIAKSFWGPKVAPGSHIEKGSLRSHDAAAHRRQFRPVTIWVPPDQILDPPLPMADVIIKWLVREVWRAVATRFEYLPRRAKSDHPVNILIIKPLPCPAGMQGVEEYIAEYRTVNH